MAYTSVFTFRDRQGQRLAAAVRLAYPLATPEERVDLERLTKLVKADQMGPAQALEIVAQLRREQAKAA